MARNARSRSARWLAFMSLLSDEYLLQVIRGTTSGYPATSVPNVAARIDSLRARWLHRCPRQSSRGDAMPRLNDATAEASDRRISCDKLPMLLARPALNGLRNGLRKKNQDSPGRGRPHQ